MFPALAKGAALTKMTTRHSCRRIDAVLQQSVCNLPRITLATTHDRNKTPSQQLVGSNIGIQHQGIQEGIVHVVVFERLLKVPGMRHKQTRILSSFFLLPSLPRRPGKTNTLQRKRVPLPSWTKVIAGRGAELYKSFSQTPQDPARPMLVAGMQSYKKKTR